MVGICSKSPTSCRAWHGVGARHPRVGGDPGLYRDTTAKSLDPRLRGDDEQERSAMSPVSSEAQQWRTHEARPDPPIASAA
ncbi:hypothetical protein [Lysobacter gummosus]|uniref:hypothetical protein n=1 Tax=Lysobacter gummosus TaxID=262324 RepID=UPI0011E03454